MPLKRMLMVGLIGGMVMAGMRKARSGEGEGGMSRFRERFPEMAQKWWDEMPDTLPLKRAMNSLEAIEASNARIVELLEAQQAGAAEEEASK